MDLVLTDIGGVTAKVLPGIADHNIVEVTVPFPLPETNAVVREVWHFQSAEWHRSNELLSEADWHFLQTHGTLEGCRGDRSYHLGVS